MKKVVIALIVIGIPLLFYFLCGKTENKEEPQSPLLSNTMTGSGERTADGGTEVTREENRENVEKVAAAEESGPAQEDTVTFMLPGDTKVYTYKAINGFKKISMTSEYTGHVANFAGNMGAINTSNQATYSHVISIMLPPDVIPGPYNEKSGQFLFQFFGSENGKLFTLDANYPFTVNVTEWGGPGGRARGSFAGQLMADESGDVITIQDGRFDVGIQ
jgi:hypothetical protein